MNTLSYTTVRNHLAQTMNEVCIDHTPVVITRGKSQPVVMMSLEDYEAMQETNYLMRSPKNATRLLEAIDEIESMIADKQKK